MRRCRRHGLALLGVAVLGAGWQLGYVLGGPFVLPRPSDSLALMLALIGRGAVWHPALVTTGHVLEGYAAGCGTGLLLGLAGGASEALGVVLGSISTMVLGVPPIIWIVLALFWFSAPGAVPPFTVAIGTAPIIFTATVAGWRSALPEFDELGRAYGLSMRRRFFEIRAPQAAVVLAPAFSNALALAWKMALMAEVLSGGSGLGGRVADSRANLDTTQTMAWVLVAVALLMATDRLLAAIGARVRLAAERGRHAAWS